MPQLLFNPGLTLTGFRTTRPSTLRGYFPTHFKPVNRPWLAGRAKKDLAAGD